MNPVSFSIISPAHVPPAFRGRVDVLLKNANGKPLTYARQTHLYRNGRFMLPLASSRGLIKPSEPAHIVPGTPVGNAFSLHLLTGDDAIRAKTAAKSSKGAKLPLPSTADRTVEIIIPEGRLRQLPGSKQIDFAQFTIRDVPANA